MLHATFYLFELSKLDNQIYIDWKHYYECLLGEELEEKKEKEWLLMGTEFIFEVEENPQIHFLW